MRDRKKEVQRIANRFTLIYSLERFKDVFEVERIWLTYLYHNWVEHHSTLEDYTFAYGLKLVENDEYKLIEINVFKKSIIKEVK